MIVRTRTLQQWLLLAAGVCLGACLLRNLGVVTPVLPNLWDQSYHAAEYLSIAVCGLRAWQAEGTERAAWSILALGMFGSAAGDVYYAAALGGDPNPPTPSPADAGYLSIYPAAYAGLVLLLRARAGRLHSALWLDGLVCALASAAVGAELVLGLVTSAEGSFAAVATNAAYPLGDLTMLAFAVAVMVITGRSGGSTWRFIALAFAVWAVADAIFLNQVALDTYREFTPLDTCWPATYVLLAIAAVRPPQRLDARRLRGGMLVIPAAFTLIALGLLVLDHYSRRHGVALWLATAAIATAVARFGLTFRENLRTLGASEVEATTDALTGLGNRRALLTDLDRLAADATPERPVLLTLFDLDGFKAYNDSFGHLAGDALLHRLGHNLADALGAAGTAYRVGGDEFCLLSAAPEADRLPEMAAVALSESGERFEIRSSYGSSWLTGPEDPSTALRLADQRMYANKRSGRRSTDETVHQVLLRVAAEHGGELSEHLDDVADMVGTVGRRLGLGEDEVLEVRRAAALRNIGKIAIPDAILEAPRPLTQDESQYMRQHTIIGERIIAAAPELHGVARIVRSSHERWDGHGYPDRLAGEEIPLGARIVAVCAAYEAMVSHRPHRRGRAAQEALDELERCAGTQFDRSVVGAFRAAMANDFTPHECAVARKASIERALDVIN